MSDTSAGGTERRYKCPECGNEETVSFENDSTNVLLGCSNGHGTKNMAEVERSRHSDTDRALAKTTVLVWLVVVVFFIAMLSVLAILPGGIA